MRQHLLPAAFAVVLGLSLCVGIQEAALHGHAGWTLARRGVAARNTLRHGLVATRFAPVETLGEDPDEPLVWYGNHPALTSLLCAAAVAAFGEHEWAERIVPITFAVGALWLLVALCRRARGTRFALVVGGAALSMPVWTFYGAFVNHEPIVLFAVVALTASWLARREGRRGATVAVVASTLLGTMDDWSFSFVLAPFVLWAYLDARRRRRSGSVLWIVVPALVGLAAVGAHALSLPGETVGLFQERLWGRSTLNLGFWEVVTNPLVAPRLPVLFGPAGALAILLVPLVVGWRQRDDRADALDGAVVAIWSGALAYCLVLSEGLRNHDYWLFLFAPCAPIGLATLLWEVRARARPIATAAVLAVSVGVGLLSWHDLRRLPSELAEEWPTFRFVENQVMRHLRHRTRPDESVLIEENVDMIHQHRYYLDRRWGWFRGQEGLGDWALAQGASMILLPSRSADGLALSELGARFRLTAFEDYWVVDLRAGPGAVAARRIVTRPAGAAWRLWRSLVYDPYRVEPDGARAHDLTAALWSARGHPVPPVGEGWRRRRDLEARVARANAGELRAFAGACPIHLTTHGAAGDVVGARIEGRRDGGVDVWLVVRAHGPTADLMRPLVWVSDMPERASDWALEPRVPPAWWRPDMLVVLHRVIGLSKGRHALWLRGQPDDALGLDRDRELGTVAGDPRTPWLWRY